MAELYNSVDAFVLPTRGEGWGLPAIQAMAMGLPTISTDWGGQQEFMTPQNSFLIRLDSVEELPLDSVYRYARGKKWATPSLAHTRELMKLVYAHPQLAKAVGRRARRDVQARFSEEAVADVVDRRLQAIRRLVQRRAAAKQG